MLLTFKGVPGRSSQLLIELLHPAGCTLSLHRIIRRWPLDCFELLRCQLLLLLHRWHNQHVMMPQHMRSCLDGKVICRLALKGQESCFARLKVSLCDEHHGPM